MKALKSATVIYEEKGKAYVTGDQLIQLGWVNVDKNMINDLNNTLLRYDITTPERIINFISQVSHESGAGRFSTEYKSEKYFDK